VLERGQRNETNSASGDKMLSSFESYRVKASDGAVQRSESRPPRATRTIDLLRQPTPRNQGELVWRLGLLFGAGNLLLLAIGLAATSPRRASNWNLLFALLAFIVYYNLINLGQAWVGSGRFGMGALMVTLHGGVLLLALSLMWWRDHSSVLHLWRWRRQRAAALA
jgi:lipopolysaccharide export system permease protein